jgi:hypothetical protein
MDQQDEKEQAANAGLNPAIDITKIEKENTECQESPTPNAATTENSNAATTAEIKTTLDLISKKLETLETLSAQVATLEDKLKKLKKKAKLTKAAEHSTPEASQPNPPKKDDVDDPEKTSQEPTKPPQKNQNRGRWI